MHKNNWIGAFVLCAALAAPLGARGAEQRDCHLQPHASLQMGFTSRSGVYVPVMIEHQRALMRLDLASAYSIIYEKPSKILGLSPIRLPRGRSAVWVGKAPLEHYASSENFALGTIEFKKFDMFIIPDSPQHIDPDPLVIQPNTDVGALGMDAFANFDIELDFANHTLNLYSPDHCSGHAVYWTDTYASIPLRRDRLGNMYFPMELDGKQLETTLSTDRADTTLRIDARHRYYSFDQQSPGAETQLDSGGNTVSQIRTMALTAKGLNILNARITLIETSKSECQLSMREGALAYTGCLNVFPLHLGMNVLKNLHIYLATKEKVLYFTAAQPVAAQSSDDSAPKSPASDRAASDAPAH